MIAKNNKRSQKVAAVAALQIKNAANEIPIDSSEEEEMWKEEFETINETYGRNDDEEMEEDADEDIDAFLKGLGLEV